MSFTFLYVTAKNRSEARKLSTHLLSKKLIACANIFPIESLYRWNGKIVGEKEVVAILKTRKDKGKLVQKEIERIHSYDTPCLTEIAVTPNRKYRDWMLKQLV